MAEATRLKELLNHNLFPMRTLTLNCSLLLKWADKHRDEREFVVGDRVYLKLQPFRQNSVVLRKNLKLSSRFYGPYTVIEKVGSVAYRLDLPANSKIHPVFHVSLLKRVISPKARLLSDLPPVTDDGDFEVAPLAVLGHRLIFRRGRQVAQKSIFWATDELDATSWEDDGFLTKRCSKIHPCGQGSVKGGTNVMNKVRNEGNFKVKVTTEELDANGKEKKKVLNGKNGKK